MPPRKDDAPAGETFGLLEDGRVRIAWDGHDVTLRRPKIAEWLAYMDEIEAANGWQPPTEEPADEDAPKVARKLADLLRDGPYLKLAARMIAELAGETIATGDLAGWMCDGQMSNMLSAHWLTVPLTPSPAAGTVTR